MDWTGFDLIHFTLNRPLMVIRGSKGFLACGYIHIEAANQFADAGAIVKGVGSFEDMLKTRVAHPGDISVAGRNLGITVGMTGRDVLDKIR